MTSAEQIFCSALLGGPDGLGDDRLEGFRAYLWTITSDLEAKKRTHWLPADNPAAIASAASSLARQQPGGIAHVYVGTGLLTAGEAKTKGAYGRATNATVSGLLALTADIDVLGDVHDTKPYPPDRASAATIYQAVNLPPTMIVNTGHGIHCWWMLAEPWLTTDAADPEAERAAMYALSRDWSSTLRFHADRLGRWKIDSTFDLARVLRMPGTLNARPGDVVPVTIEHFDPRARYEISDFEAALADPEVIRTYGSSIDGVTGLIADELPGVDLSAVWARVTSQVYRLANYEPAWLAGMLEFMPGSTLEAVWLGDKTASGDPSPSGVDAALVRCLINTGRVSTEHLVEAVMCRRLRSGEKVEKVDPHKRTSYLTKTVSRIMAAAEAAQRSAMLAAQAQRAALERAAAGRIEPSEIEPDTLAEAALAELAGDEPVPVDEPVRPAAPRPSAVPVAADAPPDAALPELAPPVEEVSPVWPERPADLITALEMLDSLLIPEPFRKIGVEVWRLEYRDYGEAQKGRVVLRIPAEYEWPAGNRPPTSRPGRPFYCAWYKRDAFEVPKAFRWSLTRDALIPAEQVTGANKDAWISVIDMLVPYWQRDSSGSDMVTQVHEWLLDYLVGHAATLIEAVAVDNRRALLVDHATWGVTGAPTVLLCVPSFLEYVARQPGGLVGRAARTLLSYVDLEQRRPRMAGADGKVKRQSSWWEISGGEFSALEWGDILESAKDAAEATEQRRLRLVGGTA